MRRRRELNVFGLAFLDAMTCGLGAVVLVYMIISASVGMRSDEMTDDLRSETERLDREVLDAARNLVELRNSLREQEQKVVTADGLSRRIIEQLEAVQVELATFEGNNHGSRDRQSGH